MRRCLQTTLLFAVSLLLTSCGGGSVSVAEGGIGGTGISMGRITEFGSIYVNGIKYDTDAATFAINGASGGSQDDLAIGMVVRVIGGKDVATATGVAVSVEYSSLLTGPVDALYDTTSHTFGVMGQVIIVNSDTVFEGYSLRPTLTDLQLDDTVEISGFTDGDSGTVLATRIEVKTAATRFEVTGNVAIVSGATFQIGALTIQAGSLTIPPVGTLVKAEGNAPLSGGQLIADSIDVVGSGDGTVGDDGDEVEIEGQVTVAFDAASNRFTLNGQVVEVLSSTQFDGGASTADLTTGRLLEVEGTMSNDILLAEEIELEAQDSEKTEILTQLGIGNVDLAAKTITLMGTVIQVDNSTIFESDRDTESTFALADLVASDFLEAKVYDNAGVITASKLTLEDPPVGYNSELEGNPTDLPDPDLIEITGITVNHGATPYTFTTDRIEVKGNYDSGTGILTATEITPAD